jgi:hypothetical protein
MLREKQQGFDVVAFGFGFPLFHLRQQEFLTQLAENGR